MAEWHFAIHRADGDVRAAVERVADEIRLADWVGDSVFVKPNFTYPFFKEGVTTTPQLLWALSGVLRDLGCGRICLGEGEGGYNAFSMDETFTNFGLQDLHRHFGVEIVNLARWPSELRTVVRDGRQFEFPVPRPLFEDFTCFLSVPVPKVHCMTTISGALKNQWGVIQDVMRIRLHHVLPEVLCEVNSSLPNVGVIVDGTWGLTRNGPMVDGVALPLGWVAGCNNVFLNDHLLCELMDIPPKRVKHLAFAQTKGLVPARGSYSVPPTFGDFKSQEFYLRPNVWNRMAKLTWYSRRLNHLVYFSKLSDLLHRGMYRIRRKPAELHAKGVDWH